MKAPNPQLAEALENAPVAQSHCEHWDQMMQTLGGAITEDKFTLRDRSYSRQIYTIAALLAYDSSVRDLAIKAGINIRIFDDILDQVRSLVLTHGTKPPPAQKIAGILCKLTGVPF